MMDHSLHGPTTHAEEIVLHGFFIGDYHYDVRDAIGSAGFRG